MIQAYIRVHDTHYLHDTHAYICVHDTHTQQERWYSGLDSRAKLLRSNSGSTSHELRQVT